MWRYVKVGEGRVAALRLPGDHLMCAYIQPVGRLVAHCRTFMAFHAMTHTPCFGDALSDPDPASVALAQQGSHAPLN